MSEEIEYKHGDIVNVDISDEMKKSYLDYAMSIIVSRAIPDVCDGLKPVHRRILYSMYECGYDHSKPFKKCAKIVGDVIGKYHPHGDSSIYEALVRMAQDFSMGVTLINGQGNFGSIDDDPPAAMRYTEAKMEKISSMMVNDLDKDTVDFMLNYDGTEKEPHVLPARFPNLLINGSAGIAVGMATNIPPHNLGEVIDGVVGYIDNPSITVEELLTIIPAPDFPTDCLIIGRGGYAQAARTGRGSVIMRGETVIEKNKGRESIIVKTIPFQVIKSKLVEKIAELVKEKRIEGISDLRDESSKEGIRIVIELKKDVVSDVILNQLYSFTPLQSNFPVNMLALNHSRPELLNLLDVVRLFSEFRRNVVSRRTQFLLRKDREKAHILIGLRVAVDNIDEIIALIKSSKDTAEARNELMKRSWDAVSLITLMKLVEDRRNRVENGRFFFSDEQARAILDIKLSKLTSLESEKIDGEIEDLASKITEYISILGDNTKLMALVKQELLEVKENFATERRSKIIQEEEDFDTEDLIPREDMVIITTVGGYIKRIPLSSYRVQNRGGRGKVGISMHEEDLTNNIFIADTHTPILFFSNRGIVYKLKTHKLPLGGSNSKGRAIVNLLPLEKDESITTILVLSSKKEEWINKNIIFATELGSVRRNSMDVFENVQSNGKIAIKLENGDSLVQVALCNDNDHIMLSSKLGKCIRFPLEMLRVFQSRSSSGVRGIKLEKDNRIVSLSILKYSRIEDLEKRNIYLKIPANDRIAIKKQMEEIDKKKRDPRDIELPKIDSGILNMLSMDEIKQLAFDEEFILTITENGFGKRTSTYEYRITNRGGVGITNIITSKRNGNVIYSNEVSDDCDILMMTDKGIIIRTNVRDIKISGRNTQGITLMRTSDKIISVAIARSEANDESAEEDKTTIVKEI
ncbi:MAG: DNA gyrase subunit A [Rickettsiales bacterium]|jgi:DNA gyrase subunit A|nr:DNA gyrase subunit A [Rickettsiales bacterium]